MPLRFTLRQLEYLVAVGETGSIAAASERVNVSSPSISAAIAQLEQSFGLQLFVRRHAQGLSLTQGGRQFVDEARTVLAAAGRLNDLANGITGQVRGPLSVGCLVTFAQVLLPRLRRSFVTRYPEVDFRQYERHQAEILDGIRQARLDVALTYDLDIPADLEFVPLLKLPPYALLPPDHPLAARDHVTPQDLAPHPMVLLDLPFSTDYFLEIFRPHGLRPRVVERTRDMGVMRWWRTASAIPSPISTAIGLAPGGAIASRGRPAAGSGAGRGDDCADHPRLHRPLPRGRCLRGRFCPGRPRRDRLIVARGPSDDARRRGAGPAGGSGGGAARPGGPCRTLASRGGWKPGFGRRLVFHCSVGLFWADPSRLRAAGRGRCWPRWAACPRCGTGGRWRERRADIGGAWLVQIRAPCHCRPVAARIMGNHPRPRPSSADPRLETATGYGDSACLPFCHMGGHVEDRYGRWPAGFRGIRRWADEVPGLIAGARWQGASFR